MKLLVLAQNYPYVAHPLAAAFNERSVTVFQDLCEGVEVLVPRPYAPPLISSLIPRWQAKAHIPAYEIRHGISVYRPAYLQLPRFGGAFCVDQMAFLGCCWLARKMHYRAQFDGILSFDVVGVGGLAWRLGRILKIPASGWVTGNTPASSSYQRMVKRALNNLDLVFYQSHDLLDKAACLLNMATSEIPSEKHLVLPRGIPNPPSLPKEALRQRVREVWGIPSDHILVLSIGRIYREKGILELLRAVELAAAKNPKITCVIIGSSPAFDETHVVQKYLDARPALRHHINLLPVCPPDQVWEYLCSADIFAFTSHHEGMPNSLLEAMAMEVPAIAFAIPPVVELEGATGGIVLVPPFDVTMFGEALVRLAAMPDERSRIAAIGKHRVMEHFMIRQNMARALEQLARVVHKKKVGPNVASP